jgi:hypothetical protein
MGVGKKSVKEVVAKDKDRAAKKAAKLELRGKAAKALKSLKLPDHLTIPLPKELGGGVVKLLPLASKHGSVGYYGAGKVTIGEVELTLGMQSWVKHSKEMELGL